MAELFRPSNPNKDWGKVEAKFGDHRVSNNSDASEAALRALADYGRAVEGRAAAGGNPNAELASDCFRRVGKVLSGDSFNDVYGISADNSAVEASDNKHTGTKAYTPPKYKL